MCDNDRLYSCLQLFIYFRFFSNNKIFLILPPNLNFGFAIVGYQYHYHYSLFLVSVLFFFFSFFCVFKLAKEHYKFGSPFSSFAFVVFFFIFPIQITKGPIVWFSFFIICLVKDGNFINLFVKDEY